jgi:hypothetical protein
MKNVFKLSTFFLIVLTNKSFGEIKGFYCTASVWRVYSVLPKATATIEPIAGTHRVIEQSKGVHAFFKPTKDGEFQEFLEFKDGHAVLVRGLLAPNGTTSFVVKLVAREGKVITNILGEHREIFQQVAPKNFDRQPLSIDLSNIHISNAYLNLKTNTLDDRNYDKLAAAIQRGQLADGSITEASLECTPEY